jgi:hypothetical protein
MTARKRLRPPILDLPFPAPKSPRAYAGDAVKLVSYSTGIFYLDAGADIVYLPARPHAPDEFDTENAGDRDRLQATDTTNGTSVRKEAPGTHAKSTGLVEYAWIRATGGTLPLRGECYVLLYVGNEVVASGFVYDGHDVILGDNVEKVTDVDVLNTVTITGSVSISGAVTVSGTVAISGTVSISGAVTISGTVNITGPVTIASITSQGQGLPALPAAGAFNVGAAHNITAGPATGKKWVLWGVLGLVGGSGGTSVATTEVDLSVINANFQLAGITTGPGTYLIKDTTAHTINAGSAVIEAATGGGSAGAFVNGWTSIQGTILVLADWIVLTENQVLQLAASGITYTGGGATIYLEIVPLGWEENL